MNGVCTLSDHIADRDHRFYVIATIALKLIDKIRNMEEVKEVDMEEAPPEEEGTDAQNHV